MGIIERLYYNKKSEDKYNTMCFWKVNIRTIEKQPSFTCSKACTFL